MFVLLCVKLVIVVSAVKSDQSVYHHLHREQTEFKPSISVVQTVIFFIFIATHSEPPLPYNLV